MQKIKTIVNCLLILLVGVLTGTVFMIGVYMLPTGPMKQNVARSSALFDYEGIYPQLITGYKSAQLDNCTDAIMLGTAVCSDSSLSRIKQAMLNERVEYRDEKTVQSLNDYVNNVAGKEEEQVVVEYSRYWHGYLVLLKPILLFFDYADIRCFNLIVQTILFGLAAFLFCEKGYKRMLIPLLGLLLVLNPATEALSLQFSSVLYITMTGLMVFLTHSRQFLQNRKSLIYLFLITGIMTSFLDLLTYPLLPLGVLLTAVWVMSEDISVKKWLRDGLIYAVTWGIGYAGMWGGKWIMASVILQKNVVADAASQILLRTSGQGFGESETITGLQVLWKNIGVLIKWPYVLLAAAICIYIVIQIKKYGCADRLKNIWKKLIPFICIACIPLVWYFCLKNHSYINYWFTYRELGITVFALLSWPVGIPGQPGRQPMENKYEEGIQNVRKF